MTFKWTFTVFAKWTVLIFFIICGDEVKPSQVCNVGWFGEGCRYKCHCAHNIKCDTNGDCENGCADGWFGPACQYVDLIATNATSRSPRWLRIGDASCNDRPTDDNVTVSLSGTFPFTWMRLHFQDTAPGVTPDDFQPEFRNNSGSSSTVPDCRGAFVSDTIADIHCHLGVTFEQVVLRGKGVRYLCAVQISGGRNVALRQKATQTSFFESKTRSQASNAVDGNTNQNWYKNSCSHTEQNKTPYLRISLSQPHMINRYALYNRLDGPSARQQRCCPDRLMGFILRSYKDSDLSTILFSYTDKDNTAKLVYRITSSDKTSPISLVEVYLPDSKILTLCEVELYGDTICNPDPKDQKERYGRDCSGICNCAKKEEVCFVSTGGCPSGCAAGFTGESCQTKCSSGFYGLDCKEKCSPHCGNESICDPRNGTCSMGCQPGYTGDLCETEILTEVGNDMDSALPSVAVTVVAVVATVVVVVTLACVAIVWKVCSSRNRRDSHKPVENDGEENEGGCGDQPASEPTPPAGEPACSGASVGLGGAGDRSESAVIVELSEPLISSEVTKRAKSQVMGEADADIYNDAATLRLNSTTISVKRLDEYMAVHNAAFFRGQFSAIPSNHSATKLIGTSAENKHKNRYKDICAYDHSRVILDISKERKQGDYINASYLQGYDEEEKFIASQGPTKVMIDDFLRMITEQNVEKVVMLTNLIEEGKLKCERYWPEDGTMQIGEINVQLTTTQVFADYVIRRLRLSKTDQPVRTVTQFHFTSWPDKGVPTTPWGLVDFEQRVASYPSDKPVLVHCSAGVGRTGTFIALRNVMREAEDTGQVDFFVTVQKLREDRVNMVQTAEQYQFLHRTAQVAMVCLGTTVTTRDLLERIATLNKVAKTGQTNMAEEFKEVCAVCEEHDDTNDDDDDDGPGESVYDVYQSSRTVANKLKNRHNNILPKEYYRVILTSEKKSMGSYINAVFAPSFSKQKQQILTQLPLPTTVLDFWRMVMQYQVSLIVAFEGESTPKDTTIGEYLPSSENEPLYLSLLTLKSDPVMQGSFWEKRKLTISSGSKMKVKGEQRVTHLNCSTADLDPNGLLTLIKEIRSLNPVGEGKALYMCRNGATFSGLACVLSLLLDRMDNDHRLTVPLVVGTLKTIRPQVIPTLEQYKLLYDILKLYHETNSVYCNFGDSTFSRGI